MSARVNMELCIPYEWAENETSVSSLESEVANSKESQVLAHMLPCEKILEWKDSNSDRAKGQWCDFVRHMRPSYLVVKIVWLTCLTT